MMKSIIVTWSLFISFLAESKPSSFVKIQDECPRIEIEARYATKDNFTGSIIPGYLSENLLLSEIALEKLCRVQKDLQEKGYGLKVFDSYRPQRSVNYFKEWTKDETINQELKELYFPRIKKSQLIPLGYIAEKSSHSRGSTVDLTIIDLKTKKELDMGGGFDLFDPISHTQHLEISAKQKQNRLFLKKIMENYGFKNYSKEWWHYTLINEPHPHTYFNFNIE